MDLEKGRHRFLLGRPFPSSPALGMPLPIPDHSLKGCWAEALSAAWGSDEPLQPFLAWLERRVACLGKERGRREEVQRATDSSQAPPQAAMTSPPHLHLQSAPLKIPQSLEWGEL